MPSVRLPGPSIFSLPSVCLVSGLLAGCASSRVPNPRDAANAYADAAERGDAAALYGMTSEAGRKTYTRADAEKLVAEEREELKLRAKELRHPNLRVTAVARLRFEDGEEAALVLEDGRYGVSGAATLPGGARTVEDALSQLRGAVARRSYASLLYLLTPETRAAVEADLRALVVGLEKPNALKVQVTGDLAQVTAPGGHHVRLKRQNGVWRVENFD